MSVVSLGCQIKRHFVMCAFFSYFVQMLPTLHYNFAYRTLQFKQHYTCDVNIQFNSTPMWYCLNKPFLIKVEEAFNLSLCFSCVFKSCFLKLFSFATTQQTSGVGCQCFATQISRAASWLSVKWFLTWWIH